MSISIEVSQLKFQVLYKPCKIRLFQLQLDESQIVGFIYADLNKTAVVLNGRWCLAVELELEKESKGTRGISLAWEVRT